MRRGGLGLHPLAAAATITCRAVLTAAATLVVPASPLASVTRRPSIVVGEATALDGGTLVVDGRRVRIRALHAAEVDEPGGTAAKEMAALAVFGEHVVCTVFDTDRFGRLVADCMMSSDGADFAEVMIRAGHAAHCPSQGRPDLGIASRLRPRATRPLPVAHSRRPGPLRPLLRVQSFLRQRF